MMKRSPAQSLYHEAITSIIANIANILDDVFAAWICAFAQTHLEDQNSVGKRILVDKPAHTVNG
jgi:hypothetical protein